MCSYPFFINYLRALEKYSRSLLHTHACLLFGALKGYFFDWGRVQKLFSMLPSILTFDLYLILGSFWIFGTLICCFFGWGKGHRWKKCGNFGVIFNFLGPSGAVLGVRVWLKNCFWVNSWSLTISIFFVFFNSNFWFWLNFGAVIDFWGPNLLFLGLG